MSDVSKTTVYLNAADYRRLKAMAQDSGRTAAELVREAVAEYTRRHAVSAPRSVGLGRSGRTDLSERAEDLIEAFGTE